MQAFSLPDKLRELHTALLRRDIYPYLLLLAVTLAVWLPGGLDVGPYKLEDLRLLKEHGPDGAIFDPLITRLLRDLPVWIGMHLMPDGFEGWQGMILLLTLLRGWFLYALIRRMAPEHGLFALLCGLVALFHPADASYFYLDTPGVHLSLALALGASLCAVRYLQEHRRRDLAGMFLLQLGAGFSYSAFVPLMLALPAGAWLLERVRGGKPKPTFLLLVAAMPVLLALFDLMLIHGHVGRDAGVADFNLLRAAAGYLYAAAAMPQAVSSLWEDYAPGYLAPVLATAFAGAALGWLGARRDESGELPPPRLILAVCAGLLVLAAVGYLPYAFSTTRYSEKRQLLVTGIFAYALLLYLVTLLAGRSRRRVLLAALCSGIVAAAVTLAGLEKREPPLTRYHAAESMLADVARLAPRPADKAFILVKLASPEQRKPVAGIYARQDTFVMALRYLYRSKTVSGGMTSGEDGRVQYGADGIRIHRYVGRKLKSIAFVPYQRLIVVVYSADGQPRLADAPWLAQAAGVKALERRYAPRLITERGKPRPRSCSLFHGEYRPHYCDHPRHKPAAKAPDSSPAAGTR